MSKESFQVSFRVVETFQDERIELLPFLDALIHFGRRADVIGPRFTTDGLDLGRSRRDTFVTRHLKLSK